MKIKTMLMLSAAVTLGAVGAARAQNAGFTGIPISNPGSFTTGFGPTARQTDDVSVAQGGTGYRLSLSNFASEQDLTATQTELAGTQAQLNNTLNQLNATATQIRGDIARVRRRSSEGISLAAAMTIVPPNPGDRFSLTLAGAGFDGSGGGSATGSYRVADRVLVFGGYARGATQNMVKAGVSFSFN